MILHNMQIEIEYFDVEDIALIQLGKIKKYVNISIISKSKTV